ncbi:adenosine receptor A1 [Ciona intestinalis]
MNNVTALTSGALSKTAFDFEVSHEGELVAYIVAEVLIAVFALFSNLFVLIAIIKFKNLQTSTYWLLASLSVADISVAVLGIPSAIVLRIGLVISDDVTITSSTIDKAAVDRATCLVVVSFVIFLTQVSIWSLLLIAVDRFVAIHYHLRYRAIVTSFRVKAGIVGAWLGGAFIGFVPLIGWTMPYSKENVPGSSEVERCAFEQVTSMEYMVYFNFFGCVLLPLAAMFVLYFMIFRSAKQQLRKIYADVAFHRRRKLSKISVNSIRDLLHANLGIYSPPKPTSRTAELKRMHLKSRSLDISSSRREGPEIPDIIRPEIEAPKATEESSNNENNLNNKENDFKVTLEPSIPHIDSRTSIRRSLSSPMIFVPVLSQVDGATETNDDVCSSQPTPTPVPKRRKLKFRIFRKKRADTYSGNTSPVTYESHDCTTPIISDGPMVFELGRLDSDASSWGTINRHITDSEGDITRRIKLRRRSKLIQKEFRAARSLFTVIGVFALCWLPLHILNCITLFCPECRRPNWLIDFAILLSHANSLVNPIIYAFRLREMKVAFQKLLRSFSNHAKSALCCERTRKRMQYDVTRS